MKTEHNAPLPSRWRLAARIAASVLLALAPPLTGSALAATGSAATPDNGRSGKAVVESVCLSCHRAGLLGAPKINDVAAWRERAGKGLSELTSHALTGLRQMPDHGSDPTLTQLELGRAVTYMVNQSGGSWVEPASAQSLASARSGENVVQARCATCHATGEGGAPKIGDAKAWAGRASRGLNQLTTSAIRGHGGMPPRGGVANATDAELRAAITYMFNPSAATAATGTKPQPPAEVETGGMRQTVAGMDILLGVVSASRLRDFPPGSPERTMHGGVPPGSDQHHLNVTVLQQTDGSRIADAQVEVIVEDHGTAKVRKRLNAESLGGVPFYGAYVPLARNTEHRVTVLVRPPNAAVASQVQFQYRN